jgi:hypothetical protein
VAASLQAPRAYGLRLFDRPWPITLQCRNKCNNASASCTSSLHTRDAPPQNVTPNGTRWPTSFCKNENAAIMVAGVWLACICMCTMQLCTAFISSAKMASSPAFARKIGSGVAVPHITAHRAVSMSAVREVRCFECLQPLAARNCKSILPL